MLNIFIESIKKMLSISPSHRLSLDNLLQSSFFDNILISTINYLETFVEKTQVHKAQFLKGLVKILPQFSIKLIERKVLPALLSELKDTSIVPFVLPNLFWISEKISDADFNSKVLPSLLPIFKVSGTMIFFYITIYLFFIRSSSGHASPVIACGPSCSKMPFS
jgi:SCY1-like protein 2